jgi:DNA-binding LacI/PurR family transcriptional regulator
MATGWIEQKRHYRQYKARKERLPANLISMLPSFGTAANDMLALGCYDALAGGQLACPADISITGYNDMPFTDRFSDPEG